MIFQKNIFPVKYEDIVNDKNVDNHNEIEIINEEDELNVKNLCFSLKFFENVFKEIKMFEICNNVINKMFLLKFF